ncbi:unnamed protein product [Candidula unifasciata]|uniref:Very-long-chain 3-oxoacyl-CoA reductase n=1 Tax=Candidula unifasciata TaxID=100452 RepID=A0A8S3ZPR6_9EUPU|nr:unnamed protein product [Candidula unifasciata]
MVLKTLREYLGDSSDIFSAIGALTTGIIAFKIALGVFRFLSTYIFPQVLGLSANLKKAGSWAVVTGSTDGIGKAYAEQLASRGLNVVLISRTLSKLTGLASDIESKYGVKTRVIAADFSSEDIYDNIERELAGLDVGVLVNNVGVSYEFPQYYAEVEDPDFVRNMIHMNCTSVAKMTKIVLPGMVQRKCGYVINIGSSSATTAAPLLSLYSGTKAFVDVFSRALDTEYHGKGITVQCVRPYFVVSKLSKFRKSSLFVPSPTTFVKSALNTVGVTNNTTGYWSHALQDLYMQYVPASVKLHFMEQSRSRALKKKASADKSQ